VVTGLSSNQFNEQHRTQNTYEFARAGATATNPYLQQYQFQDGPKNTFRDSLSVKADWKVRPHHVLSASLQTNYYLSQFGNRNFAYNIGTTATPTTTGGQALTWTPTSVTGASGRGSVQGQTSFRDKYGATTAGNITWTYKENAWEVDASLNASRSRTWYRDTARGHFSEVRTALAGVSRISFNDINPLRPGSISIYNAAGTLIDPTLLSNYTITFGRGNPIDAYDQFAGGNLNAKYNLNLSFPAALKVGLDQRTQNRNIRRYDQSWNLAGTVTGADYVDQSYLNQDPYWGPAGPAVARPLQALRADELHPGGLRPDGGATAGRRALPHPELPIPGGDHLRRLRAGRAQAAGRAASASSPACASRRPRTWAAARRPRARSTPSRSCRPT
jgi:iron complex outermembrane receptor protein